MGSMAKLATPRFRFCQSFQVSSGDGIFRCENAVFNEIEEHIPEFFSEFFSFSGRVPNANAFRTQMEREHTVRLFLSGTVQSY